MSRTETEENTKSAHILEFGAFRFDKVLAQLTDADGAVVHLRRQSADVLAVLADHVGDIVSKECLFQKVWPGIATTDDSLVQCIADIRRILGRDVVKTFPKRGYRLEPIATFKRESWWVNHRKNSVLAASACLATIGLWFFTQTTPRDSQPIVPPVVLVDNTLAVLPFLSLGASAELRFFGDGLSEDLVTDLSKVPKLTVISHASSFDYPDAERGFDEIARDLGVRYLVRGTVRHGASRVRITVSLVDTRDGFNVWTERFDRDRENPLDVQAEVAREIVDALSLTLYSGEKAPPRIEPDAHLMLLRGLEPLRARTPEGNLQARAYFERALQLDPNYARAYANIAITYGRETRWPLSEPTSKTSIEKGLEAAVTAIQLDPELPHAYFALGVLNLAIEKHEAALSATRHAIKLNGNYSDGYALLAEISVYGGDLKEALVAIRRAKLLHPHHPASFHWIEAQVLFHLGKFDEAQPILEAAVKDNPKLYQALILLAANYGHRDNIPAAVVVLGKVFAIKPSLSLETELMQIPFRDDVRRQNLVEGLAKVGVFK